MLDIDKELEGLQKADVKEEKEVKQETPAAEAVDTPEQTKVDQGMLDEINDLVDLPPVETTDKTDKELPAKEEKEPVKDTVEPGSDVKKPDVKPPTLEDQLKDMTEKRNNSDMALRESRNNEKLLKDQLYSKEGLGKQFTPGKELPAEGDEPLKKESGNDPDVDAAIDRRIDVRDAEKAKKEEAQTVKDNEDFYLQSLVNVQKEHPDVVTLTETFFAPLLKTDQALNAEFLKHENPAQFAYDKAIEKRDSYTKEHVDKAVADTTKEVFDKFKDAGLPVSFSTLTGGPKAVEPKKGDFDKELDELLVL